MKGILRYLGDKWFVTYFGGDGFTQVGPHSNLGTYPTDILLLDGTEVEFEIVDIDGVNVAEIK